MIDPRPIEAQLDTLHGQLLDVSAYAEQAWEFYRKLGDPRDKQAYETLLEKEGELEAIRAELVASLLGPGECMGYLHMQSHLWMVLPIHCARLWTCLHRWP